MKWKVIPGFSSYKINGYGDVVRTRTCNRKKAGQVIKAHQDKAGYMKIRLYDDDGVRRSRFIHRLVLAAFVGTSVLECNHKNRNKADNRLSNLEYCTPHENMKHSYTFKSRKRMRGELNGNSRLCTGEVWLIKKLLYHNVSQRLVCKMFHAATSTINHISKGRTWKHVQYP